MTYGFLADVVAMVHFGYVAFVVGGLMLILVGGTIEAWFPAVRRWRWVHNPWFRLAHMAAISLVIAEHVWEWDCPLTDLEDHLRDLNGEKTVADRTFVGDLMNTVMCMDDLGFNEPILLFAHYGVAALIVVTFMLVPPRFRRQAKPVAAPRAAPWRAASDAIVASSTPIAAGPSG